MAFHNRLDQKHLRRFDRKLVKQRAAKRIPHLGVVVGTATVRRHRYLKAHGMPYSSSVAAVTLRQDCLELSSVLAGQSFTSRQAA